MYFTNAFNRIVGCVSTEHDLQLVVLAALISLFSCFTACALIHRARESILDRAMGLAWPWMIAAAGVFSSGIWATHFVAELAYAPRLPIGFTAGWTMMSLVIGAVVTAAGLYVALYRNAALGGATVGVAIGAMHFSGMQALQVPAEIHWDVPLVVTSLLWGVALGSVTTVLLLRRTTWTYQLCGTALLVLAICGLHFTAMAALRLVPSPLLPVPEPFAFGDRLAAVIAIVTATIVMAGQVAVIIDAKLARSGLHEAYGRLAGALESLPAGIALFDHADRLVVSNETYRRVHSTIADIMVPGTTFETILRKNVQRSRFDLGDQEKEAYIVRRLAQHRNPGEAFERRLTDGRWERVSEQRMADGGLSLVIIDITRDKEREAALLTARDAADAINRAKSSFLANMSHELRTPLNAILGFSEAMTSGLFGALGSPRYAEYAADINKSGRYLHQLITDILDMAKIEAGHRELAREPVDCATEIEDALTMIRQRAESGGVIMQLQQDNNLGAVLADQLAFKQILINLIGNAVKFTPPGGTVIVHISSSGRDGMLQVIDTGVGIGSGDMKNLGTPFFRTKDQLTAATEGTGLGLALTRSLVELHGWKMDIASELGRGTTVTIDMLDSVTPATTSPLTYAAAQ
jgi:signal transduction histidine kinase/NO-binding membrane sensor protein with MHYT domain